MDKTPRGALEISKHKPNPKVGAYVEVSLAMNQTPSDLILRLAGYKMLASGEPCPSIPLPALLDGFVDVRSPPG